MIEALCLYLGIACGEREHPPTPPRLPEVRATVSVPNVAPPSVRMPKADRPAAFPKGCAAQPPRELAAHFVAAARRYPAGATACELAKQAHAESGFRIDAVSPVGAIGISQFMPRTAQELGIDPWDPRASIFAQARYVGWCRDRWTHGLGGRTMYDIRALGWSTYNYGLGSMRRSQERHGWTLYDDAVPHLPHETQNYVAKIEGAR